MDRIMISILTMGGETTIIIYDNNHHVEEKINFNWGKHKPGFPVVGLLTILLIFFVKKIKAFFCPKFFIMKGLK